MYRELGPEEHRRVLGLGQDELPEVLLLLGIFNVHEGAQRFSGYLEEPKPHRRFPSYLATYRGMRVALAAAFGGPMAALHAHIWLGAGVPAVIQLGWFGALQPGMALGDVIVPTHAAREDGVSDWYLAKGLLADSSPELSATLSERLRARGIPAQQHPIFSTPALMAESREVIADWSRHGWYGVDMETAATFAVAKALGAQRAAALMRLDDLVAEDHSLAETPPPESVALLRAREADVTHAALEAIADLRGLDA